jgi:ABC-type transport system substrate-binding protein
MSDLGLPPLNRRTLMTVTGAALAGTAVAVMKPDTAVGGQRAAAKMPKKGGAAKIAIIGEPPVLDPGFTTATISQSLMWHVIEGLFTRGAK